MARTVISSIILFVLVTIFVGNAIGYTGKSTVLNGNTYKWIHSLELPSNIEVSWIDSDPEHVTIEMRGPTKGYIAIGFSPTGGMTGADMFIGWVDSNGTAHLLDMFGSHNGQPILDRKQDLELLGGREDEEGTTIVFRRKWDTCDDEHEDFPIGDDTMRLIWATSAKDPVATLHKGYVPKYHSRDSNFRGVRSTFMKVRPNPRKFPDQEDVYPKHVKHVDLTVHDVVVPKKETYYHCSIVKFPKLQSKHHIIAVSFSHNPNLRCSEHRPLIANASLPHIHHINIYKCHVPEVLGITPGEIFEKYVGRKGGDCYTEDSPHEWTEYCFEFRIAIGVGSEGDMLPDHLGDVIGDTDGPTYYRIEVHYENPEGKDLIDSSGIRVFYTSILREFETAVLFAGHRRTPFLTIPPHQKQYTTYSFCGSECTKNGLAKEGIKIISVLLHAHLTGKKIVLRHIRNGKELPPIAQDSHIDFNYQHYRQLKEEVTVLPGDELITECTFDTSKNDTFVYGGLSTRREMCESFIIYYPKSTLIDCRSQPEFYTYFHAIGVENAVGDLLDKLHLPLISRNLPENLQNAALADDSMILENGRVDNITHDIFRDVIITRPKDVEGMDVHDYMMNLNWDDIDFVKSVEEHRKSGYHYMHCSAPGGKKIHTTIDYYPFPVYEPYIEVNKPCLSTSAADKSTHSYVLTVLLFISNVFIIPFYSGV